MSRILCTWGTSWRAGAILLFGGNPLYNFLQAGNTPQGGEPDSGNLGAGIHEHDRDQSGTGFWSLLSFEAEVVECTP
ncbi:MAG: hypothetical protein AB8I08_37090 [Sandaracinaceae bacterium]